MMESEFSEAMVVDVNILFIDESYRLCVRTPLVVTLRVQALTV
jgi:hypothetical protein